MATFYPTPGMYFYASVKPRQRVIMSRDMTEEVVIVQDNSYSGTIFKAMACDATHIVAVQVVGSMASLMKSHKQLLRIADYTFSPVGPDVLAVMLPPQEDKEQTE